MRLNLKSAKLASLLDRLPDDGRYFIEGFSNCSMKLLLYAPLNVDNQSPHPKDEVYIVARGKGYFVLGDERVPSGPGEAFFVPAGAVHRFEEFSEDFAVWVVFYGPKGGEDASTAPSLDEVTTYL